ncbi:hypothetical protein [Streptomyces sp. NPDC059176]|uniref:hypothetical protein n=1 Tax=Streptomyces sp. NPDC059176 TaxID=3346758 RepID=UPI003693EE5B
MADLCNSQHSLYGEDIRERAALDEAVAVDREAETLTRVRRDSLRGVVTGNLQSALVSLFVRTGDGGVADEAVAMGTAAIAAFTAGDPRRGCLVEPCRRTAGAAARAGDRTRTNASIRPQGGPTLALVPAGSFDGSPLPLELRPESGGGDQRRRAGEAAADPAGRSGTDVPDR